MDNSSIHILSSKTPNIGFSGFFPNLCTDDFWKLSFSHYYYQVIDFVTVNKNVPGNFSVYIGTKRPPEFSILLMKIQLFHVLEI